MAAIGALLAVVAVAVLITRIAATALEMTGVSRDLADFQSKSAYTGVGFTTTEAEHVVAHPARRRIIVGLMLFGNAGIATVVASLVVGFAQAADAGTVVVRLGVLVAGLLALWWLTRVPRIERALRRSIGLALDRWTDLRVSDYVRLLGLEHDYEIRELTVEEGDWLEGRPLDELGLPREGVLVLGIRRASGDYLGAPASDTQIGPGDIVLAYGRVDNLAELDDREAGPGGEAAHRDAVSEHDRIQAEERERDQGSDASGRSPS